MCIEKDVKSCACILHLTFAKLVEVIGVNIRMASMSGCGMRGLRDTSCLYNTEYCYVSVHSTYM